MRFPPNWSMELLLVVALFASVVVAIFAMREEKPGDRTRFTLERSEAAQVIGERRLPLAAQETGLAR